MKNSRIGLALISVIAISFAFSVALVKAEETGGQDEIGPQFIYYSVPIAGTLSYNHQHAYGPYYPYAISVSLTWIVPSGKKLSVSIKVNGVQKWSGLLGAGQSSPTITSNGGTTYIYLKNLNADDVSYTGNINLIYN